MQNWLRVTLVALLLLISPTANSQSSDSPVDYFSAGQYRTRHQDGVTIYSKDTDPPGIHYHHARSPDTPDYGVFYPYPPRRPLYPRRPFVVSSLVAPDGTRYVQLSDGSWWNQDTGEPMRNGSLDTGPGFPFYVGQVDNRPRPRPGVDIDLGGGFWLSPDNPQYGLKYILGKHGLGASTQTNKPELGIFNTADTEELKAIIADTVHEEPGVPDNTNPNDPRTVFCAYFEDRSIACMNCPKKPIGTVYYNQGRSGVPAHYVWVIVNALGVVIDAFPSLRRPIRQR